METKSQKLETPLGKSYWGENGAYQSSYDSFWDKLVPSSGYAPTIHGEMIRSASRLFYEYCNNGNGNALDRRMETCHNCEGCGYEEFYDGDEEDGEEECRTEDCSSCDGRGECEEEVFITEYYQEMVDFLLEFMVEKEPIRKLEKYLNDSSVHRCTFNDKEMDVYNKVVDAVMYQVLTTNNNPNPYYKKED
jgi:hypothetical protein